MSGKKKVNPRRRPASQADVLRAKRQAEERSVNTAWAIIFTVLRDKEGYDVDGLQRVWSHVNDLSDSIAQGYCTVADLKDILKQEEGAVLK